MTDIVVRLRSTTESQKDLLAEAARHITYLRTLLKACLDYVPDSHPWMPGLREEAENLNV
jgi:hypothetical protein